MYFDLFFIVWLIYTNKKKKSLFLFGQVNHQKMVKYNSNWEYAGERFWIAWKKKEAHHLSIVVIKSMRIGILFLECGADATTEIPCPIRGSRVLKSHHHDAKRIELSQKCLLGAFGCAHICIHNSTQVTSVILICIRVWVVSTCTALRVSRSTLAYIIIRLYVTLLNGSLLLKSLFSLMSITGGKRKNRRHSSGSSNSQRERKWRINFLIA